MVLASVAITCFERLVMVHINTIPDIQFAYRPNRSTDDTISIALHTVLSHLDKKNTYVRTLLIRYSSVFNTIVPSKLFKKAMDPGTKHLPLQLDPGLPDGTPPGGEGR
jgi:hypothetical protein